jgi:murein L,D-transpeptidase YcbB/YkuD
MYNSRYNRILAGTALALILAIPLAGLAKNDDPAAAPTAAPAAATPSALPVAAPVTEPAVPPAAPVPAPATQANEPPEITDSAAPAAAATGEPPAGAEPAAGQTAATEPAAAPDPLASLDAADRPVAEKIRDLLASKPDAFFGGKKEHEAIEAFYQGRNLAPLWLDKGIENARAEAVIARMKDADADGLEAADYKAPDFSGLALEGLAEAELKLTHTVLTFARHLQAGRFPYTRVSRNIELPQTAAEPADVLASIAQAADAGAALERLSPQNEPYRKLKAALAELRAKPGAAKGAVAHEIETVIANMERWRWYAHDLGDAHILVNLPDFTLRVMHNGAQVWTTRIVIGKPSMPTPLLSETMKTITVNPTWTVPQSIVRNEYLPALAQDPTVLERMGLHVSYGRDGVTITQPPGAGNALGRIRFNFRNRFSVYQHDTPDKYYFSHTVRAYSHGCMRVQDPAKYAEVLLHIARPQEHWTAARVQSLYGRGEQDLQLQPTPIWVHLTYQTAFVDEAGKLEFRRDVYGLDGRTLAAIKRERGNLEPERKHEPEVARVTPRKPAAAAPARTGALYQSPYATPGYARPFSPLPFFR